MAGSTFARGRYQGIAEEHFVEVTLGSRRADVLIASGWIYPTDSSINVAIAQAGIAPLGLSLEARNSDGSWRVVNKDLGFPAGKNKTLVIDLGGIAGAEQIRLRTNLEIYWDMLEWATAAPNAAPKVTHLNPEVADLHYRGYSVINQANASSPEIPDYNRLSGSKQIWRDLIGYYTRFGDVRELLVRADDRYVIMNAGDEMSFRFAVPAPPPAGWVRDYVIVHVGYALTRLDADEAERTLAALGRGPGVPPDARAAGAGPYRFRQEQSDQLRNRGVVAIPAVQAGRLGRHLRRGERQVPRVARPRRR